MGAGQPQERGTTEHRRLTDNQVAEQKSSPLPPLRTISADKPDVGCKADQEDRRSNLCAQWKAADAAYDSALWALWQVIFGGIGLLVGAATLAAAIMAARYARDAANETKRGADAALASLQQAREESQATLVVHLSPQSIILFEDDVHLSYLISITNVGRASAQNVDIMDQPFNRLNTERTDLRRQINSWSSDQHVSDLVIIPGETYSVRRMHVCASGDFINQTPAGSGNLRIIALTYVQYRSLYETRIKNVVRVFSILPKDVLDPRDAVRRYGPVLPFLPIKMLPLGANNLIADNCGGTADYQHGDT